jgi:hypothetical protein
MSVTMGSVTGYGRVNVRETVPHVICLVGRMEVTDGWIRARGHKSSTNTRTIRELVNNARQSLRSALIGALDDS